MAERAVVKKQRRISSVWIIPGLALVLGAWMLFNAIAKADPRVEVHFATADGIEARRTKVKILNIEVGEVEEVRLSEDLSDVVVVLRIDRESRDLLREDSMFWVVRPRIGAGGITGVGTLLSGAYIALESGTGEIGRRSFVGLETPPATPLSAEGLRLSVFSEVSGSIGIGDPVLYRGRRVGQVDGAMFESDLNRFRYDLFVEAPFDGLVTRPTRFWKASAIQLQADANGFSVNADSLQSILSGGVAFDLPDGRSAGEAVEDGATFQLYESKRDINRFPYLHYADYLLFFHDSVRGLRAGAPVEYRGIRIGQVLDVSFSYLRGTEVLSSEEVPVPALVRLYPGHLQIEDSEEGVEQMRELIAMHSEGGLQATLQRGNLLTGNLFVSLDFFAQVDDPNYPQGVEWDYDVLPTRTIGLEQIERRIVDILDTIEKLPLQHLSEEVLGAITHARVMFRDSKGLIENLDTILGSETTRALPEVLTETLESVEFAMQGLAPESSIYRDMEISIKSLKAALRDFQRLTQRLERKPSDILFSKPSEPDPEPKASK